jgi:hypothetical protein
MQMFDAKDPIVAAGIHWKHNFLEFKTEWANFLLTGIIALVIKMITTYAPLMFCGRFELFMNVLHIIYP